MLNIKCRECMWEQQLRQAAVAKVEAYDPMFAGRVVSLEGSADLYFKFNDGNGPIANDWETIMNQCDVQGIEAKMAALYAANPPCATMKKTLHDAISRTGVVICDAVADMNTENRAKRRRGDNGSAIMEVVRNNEIVASLGRILELNATPEDTSMVTSAEEVGLADGVNMFDILPAECWDIVVRHVVRSSVHFNYNVGQLCGVSRDMRDLVLNNVARDYGIPNFVAHEQFLHRTCPAFWLYEDRVQLWNPDTSLHADETNPNLIIGARMVVSPNPAKYTIVFQIFVKVGGGFVAITNLQDTAASIFKYPFIRKTKTSFATAALAPYNVCMRNGDVLIAGKGNVCTWKQGVSAIETKRLKVGEYSRFRDKPHAAIIGAYVNDDNKIVVLQKNEDRSVVQVIDEQEQPVPFLSSHFVITQNYVIAYSTTSFTVLSRKGVPIHTILYTNDRALTYMLSRSVRAVPIRPSHPHRAEERPDRAPGDRDLQPRVFPRI